MKRVLLAGVSLTVTACAMSSTTPPSSVSRTRSSDQLTTSLLSLAPTQQCTLWREAQGRRYCLDAPSPSPSAADAVPGLPATESANQSVINVGPAVEKPPVAAPRMGVTTQPLEPAKRSDVAMPAPTKEAQAQDLFVEMHRIGMIKTPADAKTIAMPALPPVAAKRAAPEEKTEANIEPKTAPLPPSNDVANLSRVAPGVFVTDAAQPQRVRQAFAPTMDAPIATATAIAAPAAASVPSWQPVAYAPPANVPPEGLRAVQLADADQPPPKRNDTVGRAPVAAVERTPLPSVQAQRVVPLKITRKATEDAPAIVEPAASLAGTQVAGTLPPLPALPPLPGETPTAAPSPPPPPPVPAVKSASSKPLGTPLPAPPAPPPLPDLARVDAAPVKAAPAKVMPAVVEKRPASVAKPAEPEAKVARAALNRSAPVERKAAAPAKQPAAKAMPAKPGSGRHLVLHSFRESSRANQLAQQYSHLDAKVASVTLHGQTWYRVVVRDGAAQRSRLASDGVRGYWPVTL
jgi:hypothetical protein